MVLRLDRLEFPRRAERTPEGYLRCDATVARTGILEYTQPDGSVVREYRPPEEVSSPASLATFGGKTVTLEHPPELLDADNTRQYAVGFTGTEVVYNQGFVRVVVTLTDRNAVESVLRGDTVEVSAGYEVDLDPTPGVTPDGERYDAIQRNIRCNHVAITRQGRAGPSVRLHLDRREERTPMAQLTLGDAVFEVPEAVAAAVVATRAARADAGNGTDPLQPLMEKQKSLEERLERLEACSERSRRDQNDMQQQVQELMGLLDQIRQRLEALLPPAQEPEPMPEPEQEEPAEDVETLDSLVQERQRTIEVARTILGPDYNWRGRTTQQIQLDALRAAGVAVDGKSDEYLRARFDALADRAGESTAAALRTALDKLPPTSGGGPLQVQLTAHPTKFAFQK